MVIDSTKDGVKEGLASDNGRDGDISDCVVHDYAVANVEWMLEEHKNTSCKVFVYGAADGETEAKGGKPDGVFDTGDCFYIPNYCVSLDQCQKLDYQLTDKGDEDPCYHKERDPIKLVDTVVDVTHALIDCASDIPGFDDSVHHFFETDVTSLILVNDAKTIDGFIAAIRSKNFSDVFCCEAIVTTNNERQPDPFGQGGGGSWFGQCSLNNCVRR